MKKIISAIMASSCLLGAQAASAAHSNPYIAPTPLTVQGSLVVNKGVAPQLTCNVTMILSGPNDNGDAGGPGVSHTDMNNVQADITFSAGDPGCPTILPRTVPAGDVSYNTTTDQLTLTNLFVRTITIGNCAGTISADWDGTGFVLDNVMLPEDTAGGDCYMTGYLGVVGSGAILP